MFKALSEKDITALEKKISDAEQVIKEAQAELDRWYEQKKQSDIQAVSDLLSSTGLSYEDIAQIGIVKTAIQKAVKGSAKAPSTSTKGNTSEYVAPPAKWCNPADPSQTYGGGRGKKPNWLIEALAAGKTMDDLLIKKPA